MWQIESIRLREITLPPKVFPQSNPNSCSTIFSGEEGLAIPS